MLATMADRRLHTEMSLRALDLAGAFDVVMANVELAPGYRPEMTTPDGPSTSGGAQALQHLRLVGRDLPALLVGSANPASGQAELRDFSYLDGVHRQRFRTPAPIAPLDYEQLVGKITTFLESIGYKVRVVQRPQTLTPVQLPAVARRRDADRMLLGFLLGALAVGLVAVLATWSLLHH